MTYSQRSARIGSSSDYTYLEHQIGIVTEELAAAVQEQDEALAADLRKRLAALEEELSLLED
ncbi:hypothetical protein C2I18_20240 [Paenibacillus sp. PK3_47]|uniref:hypothetical protein n=1 Tax=Paenibacillus sp. PK3_47 TaxID=2072642 RepID=UPI00201DAD70|nr:hypothetical protein [Paenibacillus sp. PK3_47]UQZ35644.1 hypothetical protein C2I18_20240 [Paenibacillus sp. PK3_47]